MATHRYILSCGHRNQNGGGARNEINWTYPATVALKAAIEARGGKAWIIQEEDGDKDPTRFLDGGLQQAAARCVALEKVHGPFTAYLSSHYNGGASPGFHAIFPDGANDTKAMNPLDVALCRTIRDRVKATNTVRMLSWTADSPGVMSEKETGVGAKGYRLGEFVGTLGFRQTTARVILEASSIDVASEAAYINDPHWVRHVYSEAIVNALEDVFGTMSGAVDPIPAPQPTPAPIYAKADPIPELGTLPAYVRLANGAQLVRVDLTVQAVHDTPRLRWADAKSPTVGPHVKAGERFAVSYLIIKPENALFWYSPYATRFVFDDVKVYDADVDDVVDAPGERKAA